jgi:ComF family protein
MVNKWLKIVQCLAKQCLQFPMNCLLCCQPCQRPFALCMRCEQQLPWLLQVCPRCALPLDDEQNGCLCAKKAPSYDALQALFNYAWPVNTIIAKWKYGGQLHFAMMLAHFMQERLTPRFPIDCIIPVPLHPQRLRQRGFNQSIELATYIARQLDRPIDRRSCTRTINTFSQSQLDRAKREKNIQSSTFAIHSEFKAKHVLIIEDIVTTGATINALSAALKRQGVQTVEIWCCCRTHKTAKSL